MNFLLSDDIQEFQKSLRATLERELSSITIRKSLLSETHGEEFQRELISRLYPKLAELGVFLAGIPEAQGGLGAGLSALTMVTEECARVLAPLPVFETIAFGLAPLLLLSERGSIDSTLLEEIGAGTLRVTGSIIQGHSWRIAHNELALENVALSSLSSAEKILLVLCGGEHGKSGGKVVELDSANLRSNVTSEKTIDLLRNYSRVSLEHLPFREIGALTSSDLLKLEAIQGVLAAAEIIGVATRVEELTLDYVKTRKQFGSPIGSFQAIQHKLADVHLAVESAQSLLRFAAWSADHDPAQFLSSALGVKALASDSLPRAIEACLQAHGGIGFTFEYDLHLYLRRASMMATQFGTGSEGFLALGKQAVA